mgnify:CR=1 FL=1
MTQTRIRRGSAARLSTGTRASRPRPSAGSKTSFDKVIARLPVSGALLQRGMTWGIVLVVVILLGGVASFFGLPGMARMELAELAARAGYEVQKVEVRGTRRMDEMTVYSIALGQVDRSMLNVDPDPRSALPDQEILVPTSLPVVIWHKDLIVWTLLPLSFL